MAKQRTVDKSFSNSDYGLTYSFFKDLAAVAVAERAQETWALNPNQRLREFADLMSEGEPLAARFGHEGAFDDDTVAAARERLHRSRGLNQMEARAAGLERRDVTAASGAANFLAVAPGYIADAFAASARSQARLADALPVRELPKGKEIKVPRLSTGASSDVHDPEGSAADETDIVGAAASSPVAMVQGIQDFSQQAADWVLPEADELLAAELGRSLGADLDEQILLGSGANGQTEGLVSTTGIIENTYTQASPTAVTLSAALWDGYAAVAGPSGYGTSDPDEFLTIVHPRRYAQLAGLPATLNAHPGDVVQCGAVRTDRGAGTNEDEAFVLARDESFVALGPVRFLAIVDFAGAGNLQIRFVARQFMSAMWGRAPESVCRISGTGLVE